MEGWHPNEARRKYAPAGADSQCYGLVCVTNVGFIVGYDGFLMVWVNLCLFYLPGFEGRAANEGEFVLQYHH